jgi:hypothetical protein
MFDSSIEYDASTLATVVLKTYCDDASKLDDVIPFSDCIIFNSTTSGDTVGIDAIVGDGDGFGDGTDVGCDDG